MARRVIVEVVATQECSSAVMWAAIKGLFESIPIAATVYAGHV